MKYCGLSDDLALQVFEHVSQEDKLRLSLVCKPWRKLLAESPTLWQTFSVNQPPKRTLASLSSLLEFLQSHKPCVRQLTFQPKDFGETGRKWHDPDDVQADHALAPLLCAVGPHLRQLTFASESDLEVATMYEFLSVCSQLEKVTIRQRGCHAGSTEALQSLQKLQFLDIRVYNEYVDPSQHNFLHVNVFCFPKHLSTLILSVHTEDVDLHDLFDSMTVLSSLARLHLCTCGDDKEMSLVWRHLRSLESLHLQGFEFAPAWASDFSCLTKLTLLSVAGLDEPVPLHELASLPALQTLHLKAHCDPAGEPSVVDLDVLPDLPPTMRELRVVGMKWDRELSSLRGLANLRVCMLHGTGPVSLPAHMPHLHTLVLDCNDGLVLETDGLVLEDHLTGFTALRLLSLRNCRHVVVPSAFHQLAALPHLTCIDVAGSLPVNQLEWSAYSGLPLHGTGCEQQSREQPSDHRDGSSGKTGQDATRNAQMVSVAQPMARRFRSWPDSWPCPSGQAPDGGVPGLYDARPYLVYEGMIMYYDL